MSFGSYGESVKLKVDLAALKRKAALDSQNRLNEFGRTPRRDQPLKTHLQKEVAAAKSRPVLEPGQTHFDVSDTSPATLTSYIKAPHNQPSLRGAPEGKTLLPATPDQTIGLPLNFIDGRLEYSEALALVEKTGIPRFGRLTAVERTHETAFADAVSMNLAEHAETAYDLAHVQKTPTYVFEVDAAKRLYDGYGLGRKPSTPEEAEVRAVANHALHPTATAITRTAFLKRLDELSALPTEAAERRVLVTNGGCAAGKGSLTEVVRSVVGRTTVFGAVWDAAGEQEARENQWVLEAANARALPVVFAFAQNDPLKRYQDVMQRFDLTGRVVDPITFARSYVIGTENFRRFLDSPEFKKAQSEGRAAAIGVFTGAFNTKSITDASEQPYPEMRPLGQAGVVTSNDILSVPSAQDIVTSAVATLEASIAERKAKNDPSHQLLAQGALNTTAKFGPWSAM